MSRHPGDAGGQALTDTIVMMSFVSFIIFGFMHLCLLEATKSMVSLAAFSAARAVMVLSEEASPLDIAPIESLPSEFADVLKVQTGWPAAWQVLDGLRWSHDDGGNRPDFPLGIARLNNRVGLMVTYRVPFGPSILNAPIDGLRVTAISPYVAQHKAGDRNQDIEDGGDNAQR
jgi:hypothetical protein